MPGADDFTGPVGYAPVWTVVAVVLPLLVVAWYAGVTWLTRDRTVDHRPGWLIRWSARRSHLKELDRIESALAAGRITPRQGHQAVSATVRSFVTSVGPVDATTMNLRQLRSATGPELVGLVQAIYPPAFAPSSDREEEETLGATISGARELVSGWRS